MDEVQYHEDCTLRGAPGTVVEVVGEIHFLQNAWLDGSLRFVKAKGSQKAALPMQHRCLDVGAPRASRRSRALWNSWILTWSS